MSQRVSHTETLLRAQHRGSTFRHSDAEPREAHTSRSRSLRCRLRRRRPRRHNSTRRACERLSACNNAEIGPRAVLLHASSELELPEPARASQSQPEPARASQSQPEPARASQSRPESARVGQSRPESARVGQSRPESHLRHASRRRSAFAPPDDRRHERADHRAGVVARPLQLQLRDEVCERHVVPGVVLRLDIMFPLQAVVLVDTSRVRRCPDAPHRRTSRTAEVPRLSMESESGTRVSVP
jgi:hypothetical protein